MINSHKVFVIAAADEKNGLGRDGKMAWRLKKEMRYFVETTEHTDDPVKKNLVVMGRTTWESLPEQYHPLPGRRNAVLTRQRGYQAAGAAVFISLDEAFKSADENIENIFVIGGAQIYREAVKHPAVDGIYLTKIKKDYQCDVFFPTIPASFRCVQRIGSDQEDGVRFEYFFYRR